MAKLTNRSKSIKEKLKAENKVIVLTLKDSKSIDYRITEVLINAERKSKNNQERSRVASAKVPLTS